MTDTQISSTTTFLQIMGVWMIAFQLIPTLLNTETEDHRHQRSAGRNLFDRVSFYLIGLAATLGISGAWYLSGGQTRYSAESILFLLIASVLYVFLALIQSLPKTKLLLATAVMTWLLMIANTWMYCLTTSAQLLQLSSWWSTFAIYSPMVTVIVLSLFVAVFVASTWVESFMSRWSGLVDAEQGLPSAGKWIGRFERFLIVCCLLANQPTGIAILITAKGILRFGEIKDDEDQKHQRQMVEYILIGSMCSYSIALSIGWIACFMIPLLQY